jgi:hypothetical protein
MWGVMRDELKFMAKSFCASGMLTLFIVAFGG